MKCTVPLCSFSDCYRDCSGLKSPISHLCRAYLQATVANQILQHSSLWKAVPAYECMAGSWSFPLIKQIKSGSVFQWLWWCIFVISTPLSLEFANDPALNEQPHPVASSSRQPLKHNWSITSVQRTVCQAPGNDISSPCQEQYSSGMFYPFTRSSKPGNIYSGREGNAMKSRVKELICTNKLFTQIPLPL